MADFVAVLRRAVDGLASNTPEMRSKLYDKARGAVVRQLTNMKPRPQQDMLRRQMEKLEAAIGFVEGEQQGSVVVDEVDFSFLGADLEEEKSSDDIPLDEAGPSFRLGAFGKLALAPASFASDLDLAELGAVREVLTEAADELVAVTTGSNTHHSIHLIAKKYRGALGNGRGDLAVDLLYLYGVRLQNAAERFASAVAAGDLPDGSFSVGEALDSVVALHAPAIMSTEVGRELVRKAQSYSSSGEELQRFRALSEDLVAALDKSSLLERDTADDLAALAAGIFDGPDTGLTAQAVRASNNNAVAWCAKALRLGAGVVATTVVTEGLIQSRVGAQSVHLAKEVLDHIWTFFGTNAGLLLDLAALPFADLQWVASFIRWLETKKVDQATEEALHELSRPLHGGRASGQ